VIDLGLRDVDHPGDAGRVPGGPVVVQGKEPVVYRMRLYQVLPEVRGLVRYGRFAESGSWAGGRRRFQPDGRARSVRCRSEAPDGRR